uniref:Cytoplasmic tRNA 2-thiolation protein 2 n=1 Tax=Podospora anserina (strain S / ATCC MYA-4624 / DSM 980 / FGSC 10383) TaxID=515849 RepID=A0A090CXJ5_PODAN|nr:Putative protein of unknown function [Podospora anserina S mat+]
MTSNSTAGSSPQFCTKCRTQEATHDQRSHAVCVDCFTKFINTKSVKQLGILGKETKPPIIPNPSGSGPPQIGTRRYLLGLSLGVSSTCLLQLLHENCQFQLSKGRPAPFELTVVHIYNDTFTTPSTAESFLLPHKNRYPTFTFLSHPLSSSLTLPSIDWPSFLSALSLPPSPVPTLPTLLSSLPPSQASQSDIISLLTRHILLSLTLSTSSQALLLGHSTTAIAELTLSQTTKGRGFSLPWTINDGLLSLPNLSQPVLVFHPLRDILRKELVEFTKLTSPPLTGLIPDVEKSNNPEAHQVLNHKDLSIEEVMTRYFADVERSYPSVVANVARTSARLVRIFDEDRKGCGLCGMPMDGEGDERWRGELGEGDVGDEEGETEEGERRRREGRRWLCYGCQRSALG